MDRLHAYVIAFCLFLLPGLAGAGYAQTKLQGGTLGGTAPNYTFKGGSSVNDGAFWTSSTITVGGKTIDLGTSIGIAANAASFAVSTVKGGAPWGTALAIAAWLAPYGIEWYQDQWQVKEPGSPPNALAYYFKTVWASGTYYYDQPDAASTAEVLVAAGVIASTSSVKNCQFLSGSLTANQQWRCDANNANSWPKYSVQYERVNCASGYVYSGSGQSCVPLQGDVWRPPTEAEWDAIRNAPLPDAVPDSIADTVPFPVQAPEIAPKVETLGSPYPGPNGDTVQDVVTITQAPDVGPDIVDVQTGTEVVGGPAPNPSPDPNRDITQDPPTQTEKFCTEFPEAWACRRLEDWCKVYKDTIGCLDTNLGEDTPTQPTPQNLSLQPASGFGSDTGSCPPGVNVALPYGRQLSFSYQAPCTFFAGVRPAVIAAAWIGAILFVLGGFRSE